MRITVWGCRGSLPTPGPHTVRYGGNTTCVELSLDDGTVIVLDAGSGLRNLGTSLLHRNEIRELHLYVTHTHWDHLLGFPFFGPSYLPDFTIHVRGGPAAKGFLKETLERQMRPPYFPVAFRTLRARFNFHLGEPEPRTIGSCEVEPIRLNHPNGGFGFRFVEGGRSLVFLPDNELDHCHVKGMDRAEFVRLCRGADLLLHDSQYTDEEYERREGWGHSRISSVLQLAMDAEVKRLGLFHHDPDRSDDQMDAIEEDCRRRIRAAGSPVECFATREGMQLEL